MSTDWLILSHIATTWAMTGLIWFVQVVHYPLFALASGKGFATYESQHARRTTWVVAPLMLLELLTGVLLVFKAPQQGLATAGLGLLILIWLSTFVWQVPQHRILSAGFDARAHRRLVRSNWVRCFGWTARSLLVLGLIPGTSSPMP